MAKKELQVFSISFLDLLSGALAAVIILFVIVPKMDVKSKDAADALKDLGLEVQDLKQKMQQLENSVDKKVLQQIMQQMEKVEKELQQAVQNTQQLKEQVEKLQAQVEDLKKYKQWMDNCGLTLQSNCPPKKIPTRGFSFRGKSIVFVVDVSGSMISNNFNEDRLSPVKAGLRMLISTMDESYNVDVMRFPYQSDCDNKANFGSLQPMTEANKESLSLFIRTFRAKGGTPIREALEYVMNTYTGLTDIVLMTDGEPGCRQGDDSNKLSEEILAFMRQRNPGNIQVNAIGVGKDFFDDPNAVKVKFLERLTQENGNGFLIKFD